MSGNGLVTGARRIGELRSPDIRGVGYVSHRA
jgi:hypothetical protein